MSYIPLSFSRWGVVYNEIVILYRRMNVCMYERMYYFVVSCIICVHNTYILFMGFSRNCFSRFAGGNYINMTLV